MHKIIIASILFLLVHTSLWADSVYKHTDSSGKIVYTSKPKGAGDKPANLPPIVRGEAKAVTQGLQSCKVHGGINCEAGPDVDGSVICVDGYKESATRFKFSCTTPKLEISEISDSDRSGAFKVFVRNTSSVSADGVMVEYKPDLGAKLILKGAVKIGGYESGEYILNTPEDMKVPLSLDRTKLRVFCTNCL